VAWSSDSRKLTSVREGSGYGVGLSIDYLDDLREKEGQPHSQNGASRESGSKKCIENARLSPASPRIVRDAQDTLGLRLRPAV